MREVTLEAPGKINLYLKVGPRRSDGYHDIETVFEAIDICDTVRVAAIERGLSLRCSGARLPLDAGNIAYRAADAFMKAFSVSSGVSIELTKRIPVCAGLGGGSSDAAAVLLALNSLTGGRAGADALMEIGAGVGSDVPFFVSSHARAVGRGRGERIEPVASSRPLWYLFVIPDFGVTSAEAYRMLDGRGSRRVPTVGPEETASAIEDGSLGPEHVYNDLQEATFEKDPLLKDLKEEMVASGARGAAISGSGPVLYGISSVKDEAEALMDRVGDIVKRQRPGWRLAVAATRNI